jgi:hypothetical protein
MRYNNYIFSDVRLNFGIHLSLIRYQSIYIHVTLCKNRAKTIFCYVTLSFNMLRYSHVKIFVSKAEFPLFCQYLYLSLQPVINVNF